ncbi:MAG: hypothetical protein ACI9WU_005010 [Myxococcota bacterium]|jgi:hypothetical protein
MSRTTLTLLVGLLLGAACSNELEVVADAIAETVDSAIETVTAADVAFSGDVDNVQAALDGLLTQIGDLDETVNNHRIRLEVLEATQVESDALDALASQLATLSARVNALENPAHVTCENNELDVGGSCIETTTREPKAPYNADIDCAADGKRLCRFNEWFSWCFQADIKPDEEELSAHRDGEGMVMFSPATIGGPWAVCNTASKGPSSITSAAAYRCCRDK